jgi:hypothetical protein
MEPDPEESLQDLLRVYSEVSVELSDARKVLWFFEYKLFHELGRKRKM